ncbi:ATP-binding protein [Rhodobacter sp. SY28-1]|uniref:ATP-binding protein n=1 Tax=Rhodobacter sp. SY28-1 TaxID=2562317 RepID=UPI001F11638C|nr:ATP-binding protein [Rhodobacter sp. SY28-1]
MSDHDPRRSSLTLVFQADPVSIRQALQGMLTCPPLSCLRGEDRGMAELVLAEVLNNVAEHAYAEAGGKVEIRLDGDPRGLRCLVVDEGREMPGGQLPEGRLPCGPYVALDDLPEGGFGWHLIRSLCADLAYARVDGQNRLAFVLATGS